MHHVDRKGYQKGSRGERGCLRGGPTGGKSPGLLSLTELAQVRKAALKRSSTLFKIIKILWKEQRD